MEYPWYDDPNFSSKILNKKEFNVENLERCLKPYQHIVSNYINPSNHYNSILLHMSTGTGKTLASIAIAQNFINTGKKVVVITKNKDLIFNYLQDLLFTCSRYTTEEEKKHFYNQEVSNKKIIIRNWANRVYTDYNLTTYDRIKTLYETGQLKNFNNRVVIIDEVHNIINNKGYDIIKDLLNKSYNYKLILLSATPIYDKIPEVIQINNLLNLRLNKYQIQEEDVKKYLQVSTFDNNILFEDEKKVEELTDLGVEFLKKSMKPRVMVIKPTLKDYPTIIYAGEKIGELYSKVTLCVVEPESTQERGYLKILEDRKNQKDFDTTLQYTMDMVFPDVMFNGNQVSSIGKAGIDIFLTPGNEYKYDIKKINNETSSEIFNEQNIKSYSCKLAKLLENIKKSEGKVCIYTKDVAYSGIILIETLFKKNGISNFITITGSTPEEKRKSYLLRYNSPQNDNGDDIKYLVFSNVLSEGVNFKCVRELHLFGSAWNFSSVEQVTGRVARVNSHSRLPENKRNVKIFRYCALLSKEYPLDSSIDYSKYLKSDMKDKRIKNLEKQLATSSFLCNVSNNLNKQYYSKFTDGDRECYYGSCDIKCDETINKGPEDTTTYTAFLHDTQLFYKIEELLLNSPDTNFTISDIRLKYNLDTVQVVTIMREIIKRHPLVIVVKNNYIINRIIESTPIKEFIAYNIDDGKIYMTAGSRGKQCMSFLKQEILDILIKLTGNRPEYIKLNKQQICEKIMENKHLLPRNLNI